MNNHKIILFDGVCNFCNASVNFVMVHDKNDVFRYAALQSEPGAELQEKFSFNPKDLSTFILIDGNKYYTKTTGALRVFKELGFPWKMMYIFIVVPAFIRNITYNIIAKYRYKWFGKREACRIPSPAERKRFL